MDNVFIVKIGNAYFLEDASGNQTELKWAKDKEGKVLRLPKNASNRKKFSVSKMTSDRVELTFKPQNTEPREFSLISKKLLKYATPEQLERIREITEATKARWEAAKVGGLVGRATKEVSPEVAKEMLPKLEKKYLALGNRISRYKAIIEGGNV